MRYNSKGLRCKDKNLYGGGCVAKDLSISILIDFYGELLTQKRYDVLDMYYNQDLSLSEIAEECGISRQGARDAIKHGEAQLYGLEEKLGLAKRFLDISSYIEEMQSMIDSMQTGSEKDKLKEFCKKISEHI